MSIVAPYTTSVTERRRWRPPYQTGKTVHVHAKHYKHNEDVRTVPGVCGNGFVPLSQSGNVVTRIGNHTHTRHLLMTLVSLTGDFVRHTRTVLIRKTGNGKKVFMWNEHKLLFRLIMKTENTETCYRTVIWYM